MENRKSILKMFSIVVFGYALIAFSANISSQDEDISETNEAEVTEESEMNETDNGSSLKKCLMKAKSMKDKKKCQKEDMQSVEEFIDDEELIKWLAQDIKKLSNSLAKFERIKNFLVKREPFSIENGDMTITLKVKRKVVMEKYAGEIEAMYAQTDCPL